MIINYIGDAEKRKNVFFLYNLYVYFYYLQDHCTVYIYMLSIDANTVFSIYIRILW